VHRIGFLCWVAPQALEPQYYDRLVQAFEQLDPERSFQNLASLATTLATNKRGERQAIANIDTVLREIWTASGMV
jgi:hypothetical protein